MKIKPTTRRGLKRLKSNLDAEYVSLRRVGHGRRAYQVRIYSEKHAKLLEELSLSRNSQVPAKVAL